MHMLHYGITQHTLLQILLHIDWDLNLAYIMEKKWKILSPREKSLWQTLHHPWTEHLTDSSRFTKKYTDKDALYGKHRHHLHFVIKHEDNALGSVHLSVSPCVYVWHVTFVCVSVIVGLSRSLLEVDDLLLIDKIEKKNSTCRFMKYFFHTKAGGLCTWQCLSFGLSLLSRFNTWPTTYVFCMGIDLDPGLDGIVGQGHTL